MNKVFTYVIVFLVLSAALIGLYVYKIKKPLPEVYLKEVAFNTLPGWNKADLRKSLKAFKVSCKVFLKQNPDKDVGSKHIALKAKDWYPICEVAQKVDEKSSKAVKHFFETWFSPARFYVKSPIKGLFTGYYMPVVKGNLAKTEKYATPIFGVPNNLINVNLGLFDPDLKHHKQLFGRVKEQALIPYHPRKEILSGVINDVTPIIAWIESPVDLQFLEIEGSGIIELEDGKRLAIGYAAQNGRPYTSIAKILIDRGVLTKHNASMQGIRKYFKEHPNEVDSVIYQNESFVFFEKQDHEEAYGAQGVALTPGYSLAVDLKWVPLGVPLWLDTTRPDKVDKKKPMKRLMVAQDTGGAIRGPVRGDVYWGTGERAIFIAGHMKNMGYYWLLLPKTYFGPTEHNKK